MKPGLLADAVLQARLVDALRDVCSLIERSYAVPLNIESLDPAGAWDVLRNRYRDSQAYQEALDLLAIIDRAEKG